MIAICITLGANYPTQEENQNEQQQVAKSGNVASSNRGFSVSIKANSKPTRLSNTGSVSRVSNQHINDNSKRISNSGNTLRPSTKHTGGQKQRPKPNPIDDKPSAPAKPQNPNKPNPTPQPPNKPEPPQQDAPVYLLSVDTPIVKADVLSTKKKKPLIKVEVKNKCLGHTEHYSTQPPILSNGYKENKLPE